MHTHANVALALSLFFSLVACSAADDDDPAADGDADADGDGDGDSDGDGDTDSDTDSDSDADGDADGDADSDADTDADSDLDLAARCLEVGDVYETAWIDCCESPESDAAAAADAWATECTTLVASKRLTLDREAYASCLDAIAVAAETCAVPEIADGETDPCATAAVGLGVEPDACAIDAECAAGLLCSGDGVCRRVPGEWEPCPDDVCQDGYGCASGQCTRLAGDGASCEAAGCDAGLYCDEWSTTCRPLVEEGFYCSGDEQCLSGRCLDDGWCDGGASGICT